MSGGRILSWVIVAVLAWTPISSILSLVSGTPPDDALSSLAVTTFVCWGIAGCLGYFLVVSARGLRIAKERQARAAAPAFVGIGVPSSNSTGLHWHDNGNFDFEVVGESYYQAHLNALVASAYGEWVEVHHIATLLPEDNNPHDDKAVSVHINGKQVGYLSREDARSFRRRMSAKRITGPTTCPALIRGGGLINNRPAPYGVRLDMKPFG